MWKSYCFIEHGASVQCVFLWAGHEIWMRTQESYHGVFMFYSSGFRFSSAHITTTTLNICDCIMLQGIIPVYFKLVDFPINVSIRAQWVVPTLHSPHFLGNRWLTLNIFSGRAGGASNSFPNKHHFYMNHIKRLPPSWTEVNSSEQQLWLSTHYGCC